MNSKRNFFIFTFLLPTLVAFCLFYLYPIITIIYTSFCKWDFSNVAHPQFLGLKNLWANFSYVFKEYPYFWEALRNSTLWALAGIFIQIPIATIIALAFSRKMRGIKAIRNCYIIPNMISSAAMGMIFLQIYNPLYGLINPIIKLFNPSFAENILLTQGSALLAMTCSYIFFTGTTTLMILGNIMAVPEEVKEAALIDGVSGLLQDWYIVVPMIKDTLRTVSTLAATSGFLLYNEVFFLTKGAAGTMSISYIIRELAVVSPRSQFGRANAIALIQILCGMLIILFVNVLYSLKMPQEKSTIRTGDKK